LLFKDEQAQPRFISLQCILGRGFQLFELGSVILQVAEATGNRIASVGKSFLTVMAIY
jgi:hypothetical protein